MSPRPRFLSLPPARRAAILDAAGSELAAHGFEKASINRVIERAGISKGAFYYYFDDKRDLFLATLRDAGERAVAALRPPPPAPDARALWDALDTLYERIARFFASEPALAGLLKAAFSPSAGPAVAELVAEYTGRARQSFRSLLAAGVALGAVRGDLPVDLLADLVLASGEAHDAWALAHWDELGEDGLARSSRQLLDLHARLAAPLALVCQRETRLHRRGEGDAT
jgi:AcrR family transcriptional regulator